MLSRKRREKHEQMPVITYIARYLRQLRTHDELPPSMKSEDTKAAMNMGN